MPLRSAFALVIALALVAPGALALVCAGGSGCAAMAPGIEPARGAEPSAHDAGGTHCDGPAVNAAVAETSTARAVLACCCDDRDVAAEPAIVPTSQPDSSRDLLTAPVASGNPSAAVVAPQRACRSGPGDSPPPSAAGRDLLALHQTFLN